MNWIKFVLHIYFNDVQVSGQLCILIITGGINSSEGLQLVIVRGSFPGEDYRRGNGDWKKTSNPWWTPTDVQEILLCIKYWQVWCMIQTIGFISSFERSAYKCDEYILLCIISNLLWVMIYEHEMICSFNKMLEHVWTCSLWLSHMKMYHLTYFQIKNLTFYTIYICWEIEELYL